MKRGSTRWAGGLAAVSLLTLQGCGADVALPDPPTDFQGLTVRTLFEVGVADGESWDAFGGIWDIEVGPGGYAAILDLERPAVHVIDALGAHVGSIEERGLDPGALDRPSGISWGGPGQLFVWDPGSSWITEFSVDASGVELREGRRAFAFGETGFCAAQERTFLSYWNRDLIIHEIGTQGPVASFGDAPTIPGMETLGPELQEIAIEELTPSGLLCTSEGVLDVSFFGSRMRFQGWDGTTIWSRDFDAFHPLVVYTLDGVGLGRRFDPEGGTHLFRSVVPWGEDAVLVQHELRTSEYAEAGEMEVLESRIIRLDDGSEVDRTGDLPLVLAARGNRLYAVERDPFPRVVVLEVSGS